MTITALARRAATLLVICTLAASSLLAQTAMKLPKNNYTPEQDVELGREAAAEVRKQYPIIKDERDHPLSHDARRSARGGRPAELKQPVYEYSFTPVNLKEINAFALPGGPMFVHRGMFDAAAAEGEVVGVMAHELSHVLLRHGTANASEGAESLAAARPDCRRDRRRRRRRRRRIGDRPGQPVRTRHAAPAIQPRLREAGGSARRADHGARRLRPARARAHVRDDRARVEEQRRRRTRSG